MKISKYTFLWILFGAIIFISGVIIYDFLSDETASWNVYRNEVYGFTLKYPPGWEVWSQSDPERRSVTLGSTQIVFGSTETTDNKVTKVTLGIRRNKQPETVESFLKSASSKKVVLNRLSLVERFFKKEDTKITAAKLHNSWENERKEKWSAIIFYIPYGHLTLVLSTVGRVEENSLQLKVVEQIANTVEFFETAYVRAWDTVCAFPEFRSFELAIRKGEGATHIARSVLRAYINAVVLQNPERQKDVYLLPEEKVYIEDYIVKRLDVPDILYVGDIVKIPCALVEEATMKARQLTLRERGTLEEYSTRVPQFGIDQRIRDIIDTSATSSGLDMFLFEVGR